MPKPNNWEQACTLTQLGLLSMLMQMESEVAMKLANCNGYRSPGQTLMGLIWFPRNLENFKWKMCSTTLCFKSPSAS